MIILLISAIYGPQVWDYNLYNILGISLSIKIIIIIPAILGSLITVFLYTLEVRSKTEKFKEYLLNLTPIF